MKIKALFVLALIAVGIAFSSTVNAQEKIDDYQVEIKVNADSSINILEKIYYDFENQNRHGIYRTIPFKYQARGGNFSLRLSDFKVTNEFGDPYNFTSSKSGSYREIKIGDADKFVTGQKWYYISYKAQRVINYFSDHDELYWNAIGTEWNIPILQSSSQVTLPENVIESELQAQCFSGSYGSQKSCSSISKTENGVSFFEQSTLAPREGLTIVIGWPKGTTQKPSIWQNILYILSDNWILFTPIVVFLIMFFLWKTKGRDPDTKTPIVAQYEAPDNLTPAEIALIQNEKVQNKDISSEIIYLATKGFLKIKKIQEKSLFKKDDYELTLLKDRNSTETEFERKLLDGIFFGSKTSNKLSNLKNKFYKDLPEIKKEIRNSVLSKNYFDQAPWKTKSLYIFFGLAIMAAVIFGSGALNGFWGFSTLIANAIIIIAFGVAMPRRTQKGAETKKLIEGLKDYLTVAEKDRIKFHNAPKKNPQLFEKLLPYAMILGVEKEWAGQFEDIYKGQPNWYEDSSGRAFTPLILSQSLSDFSTASAQTLSSTPSQAAGGGSGFSGGGGGGGFGGGGGGSW